MVTIDIEMMCRYGHFAPWVKFVSANTRDSAALVASEAVQVPEVRMFTLSWEVPKTMENRLSVFPPPDEMPDRVKVMGALGLALRRIGVVTDRLNVTD